MMIDAKESTENSYDHTRDTAVVNDIESRTSSATKSHDEGDSSSDVSNISGEKPVTKTSNSQDEEDNKSFEVALKSRNASADKETTLDYKNRPHVTSLDHDEVKTDDIDGGGGRFFSFRVPHHDNNYSTTDSIRFSINNTKSDGRRMFSYRASHHDNNYSATNSIRLSINNTKSDNTGTGDYDIVLDNYVEQVDDTIIPRLRGSDIYGGHSNKIITAIQQSHWAALCVVVTMSCFLTYSITNHEPKLRADVSQALVVTAVLATFPEVAASAGAGAYAGMASSLSIPNYGWLALLAITTSLVWTAFNKYKLLVGCGGRLGTCAFISMNITVALFGMPSGCIPWSLYIDTAALSNNNMQHYWSQLELIPSILTVVACTFLSTIGGTIRLKSKMPLNPVQAPTTTALLCMLILEPTSYKYIKQVDAGLAVGSFVAMASEQYLSSVFDFGVAGFCAGLWILFLDPFFTDFGGKKGFTAFCGFVTYVIFLKTLVKVIKK